MDELLLLIQQLREELNALREQIAALQAENARLEDQIVAMSSKPDQEPEQAPEPEPGPKPQPDPVLAETETETEKPNLAFAETEEAKPTESRPIPVEAKEPEPDLTFDEAWDALPATEMMLAFEDDAFIRDGVDAYTHEQLTREQRKFVRGTEGDDVFVQDVFEQADFNINFVDIDEATRFPELPSGSRINGLDGYDAVHLNVDADTKGWVQLLDVEYLRVNFEPGTKTAWGDDGATRFVSAQSFSREEIPDAAYVYVDGEFGTATMFDSDFQSIG